MFDRWVGRISPGERNGCPIEYSCLESSTDRGAWQAPVHGVAKQLDTTEWLTLYLLFVLEYNCFAMLCLFLLNSKINQLYVEPWISLNVNQILFSYIQLISVLQSHLWLFLKFFLPCLALMICFDLIVSPTLSVLSLLSLHVLHSFALFLS